jgi:hypothetical protein
MKRILLFLVLVSGSVGIASANIPELFISTGTTTVTVTGAPGSVTFSSANFGGWDITVIGGKSNSPLSQPVGLDLASLTAACNVGATCADLHVWLSDVGFTTVTSGFLNALSATDSGATASVTQRAWVGLTNALFSSDGSDGTPTVPGGSPVPSVTLTGTGPLAGVATGGPSAGPTPYSLTIEDIFKGCSTSATCNNYSADGSITGVPEPDGLAFLGSLLSLGAAALWRRKSA